MVKKAESGTSGSVPEISEIFAKYKNKVYRLALSITRNEKDAEDVLQNTFLKVIKNLAFFKKKSQISTWIYRIAYNEALMQLRKRRSGFRLSRASKGLFVNWAKLPDQELLDREIKQRVDDSIRQLPIQYRMALLLDNVEGLSLKESARVLNLKINSLKTRLHRARMIVKKDISDYFKDRQIKEEKQSRKCGSWTGFVYDYSIGGLGKGLRGAFRRHIGDCRGCKSFLSSYNKAIRITRALECRDIPDELKYKIETFLPLKNLNVKKERRKDQSPAHSAG